MNGVTEPTPADAGLESAAGELHDATPQDATAEDTPVTTEAVVEAILFASEAPLPPAKIAEIVGTGDARDVRKCVAALNDKYAAMGCSFRVQEIAKGFQMLTLPAYNAWLGKLLRARAETKLSQAALETLAIVAYKQPVLRADIESIRGVAAGEVLNRLREMDLVKIVGRAEEIGRPMLYGTTRKFLEVFGLASLDDLPKAEELTFTPKNAPSDNGKSQDDAETAGRGDAETPA